MYKYTYETYDDVYQDFIFQKVIEMVTEKGSRVTLPKIQGAIWRK